MTDFFVLKPTQLYRYYSIQYLYYTNPVSIYSFKYQIYKKY